MRNHTQSILDQIFDLTATDTTQIWAAVGDISGAVKAGRWKQHYSEVVRIYNLSSRFALMRILFEQTTGLTLSQIDADALAAGFTVIGFGQFPNITAEHAETMDSKEVAQYIALLMNRVKEFDPDSLEMAKDLVARAMALSENRAKTLLTRSELLELGHMLDLTLEEMQFLLLRVLGDNEVGLCYSVSDDVIDAYGYLCHVKLAQVQELKQWFRDGETSGRFSGKKVSFEDKPADWTRDVGGSFESVVLNWPQKSHQEMMKAWLEAKAPYLNVKRKSPGRVYQNLAVYAYILSHRLGTDMADNIGTNFYDDVCKWAEMNGYHQTTQLLLFKNKKINFASCEKIATALVLDNKELAESNEADGTKAFHVIHLENGDISVRGTLNKGFSRGRKRMEDLLKGKLTPNKGDLLYLLWLIANSWWVNEVSNGQEKTERLLEYLDAAETVLRCAMVPPFYPPNIMEHTLMMAIALQDDEHIPAAVYESICTTFTKKGVSKKPKGTKSRTRQERLEVVEHYLAHKAEGLTQKQCAEQFHVSSASLGNWLNDYKTGKLK